MNKLENMLIALSNPIVFTKVWNQIKKDDLLEADQLELFASTRINPLSLKDDSILMKNEEYEYLIILSENKSEALEKAYEQFCMHEKEIRNKEVRAIVLLLE